MTLITSLGQPIPQDAIRGVGGTQANAFGVTAALLAAGLPAVNASPLDYRAAWAVMRRQQQSEQDKLEQQVREFQAAVSARNGRPAARPGGLTRDRVKQMLRNARGENAATAKPAMTRDQLRRITNAARNTLPLDLRPVDPSVERGKWSVAYHESAHAIACRIHGLPVVQATIRTSGVAGGSVTFKVAGASPFQRAVVALVGAMAERELTDANASGPSPEDHQILANALAEIGDARERDRVELAARSEACRIVVKHRADIHRVAMALLDHGDLSGDDVNQLTRFIETY